MQSTFSAQDVQLGWKIGQKFSSTNETGTGGTYQGSLVGVPIVDWYGAMLTDQQRVDRYNDLRGFQMMLEKGFDPGHMESINDFLSKQ
jgi:hypothetical protein